MSEIKILELSLRNFKGVKEFKAMANGKNIDIYGDNATGKTTIMDAFIWILFDKDSSNSSNFNVKKLDSEGKPIHMLEHEVSVLLDIDGHQVELQKIYKEKWTKKKGQADTELNGHTTDYFINGVLKKLTEYKEYLKQIVPEETFKILTNPLYFNKALDWKNRRNIVLDICEEVSQEEIFEENKDLLPIKELLKEKSIDDLKAEMGSRKRKLNEELKSIPYRIDELSRESNVEVDVITLTKSKKDLEYKLNEIKNSKGMDYDFRIRGLSGSINLLENDIRGLEQNLTKELRAELDRAMEDSSNIKKSYYEAKDSVEGLGQKKKICNEDIECFSKYLEEQRELFKEISVKLFDENSTICPTCNQSLLAKEIENLRESFEVKRQIQLNEINKKGKEKTDLLNRAKESLIEYEHALEESIDKLSITSELMKNKIGEVKSLEEKIKDADVTSLQEYKELQIKISKLYFEKKEIEELQKQQDHSKEVSDLESQISETNKQLARVDLSKENEKRVKELKVRERSLANMVAETEKIEFLCDQYVITKASLLEDKLNSKFKIVKFKLFDIQVNGGINETFITTVDGVPFEDLNNAMKINAGLDIITTLSKHYDLIAPIILDNRESVNVIPEMDAQIINLIVSKDQKLRVEVSE